MSSFVLNVPYRKLRFVLQLRYMSACVLSAEKNASRGADQFGFTKPVFDMVDGLV